MSSSLSSHDVVSGEMATTNQQVATNEPKFVFISLEPSERESELDKFVVESVRSSDRNQKYQVSRSFQDFQYLEQQLFHSGQCLAGYIVPPFPSGQHLGISLRSKQSSNNSQASSSSPSSEAVKLLPGCGYFVSDICRLAQWLTLVLEHPVFGRSGLLESFLTESNLPPPGRIIKQSRLIKTIQDTIDSRKFAHKDCDTFFQKERDWCVKVSELMQIATQDFNSTLSARNSLIQVLAHLSAALCLPVNDNTISDCSELDKQAYQDNLTLSRTFECYNEFLEAETVNEASTIGSTLLLWTEYIEAEKEMLKKRSCLLVDYESITRTLDRASGSRRTEVEEAKVNAERAFESCSDIARNEIKRFQDARVKAMGNMLMEYRDSQLALVKESYTKLQLAIKPFTSFQEC